MDSHCASSPTSISTAYWRTFTDIPYSREIFESLEKVILEHGGSLDSKNIIPKVATFALEARFKLINRILLESKINQVLELACGLGTRGLLLAEKGFNYVETDLAGVIQQKKEVLSQFKQTLPPSLYLEKASALSLPALQNATQHFTKGKEIIILHEGLLRYLSFEEKEIVAKNIHSLLSIFGGEWITCDITLRQAIINESDVIKSTKKATGMDIIKNSFENLEQGKKFFETCGFVVKVHPMLAMLDELVSPAKLGVSKEEAKESIAPHAVFEMRLKK